jgi:hypothetical protein
VAATDRLAWIAEVSADDLALVGIDPQAPDQPPAEALAAWATEYEVDLGRVHDCLAFLRSGPHLLLAGSPLALLSFSPRRQTFRASFDLDFPDELAAASFSRAGAWLTVVSSEVGELPTEPGHWLAASLGSKGLEGQNAGVLAWAQMYASRLVHGGIGDTPDDTCLSDNERSVCAAIWRSVAHAVR